MFYFLSWTTCQYFYPSLIICSFYLYLYFIRNTPEMALLISSVLFPLSSFFVYTCFAKCILEIYVRKTIQYLITVIVFFFNLLIKNLNQNFFRTNYVTCFCSFLTNKILIKINNAKKYYDRIKVKWDHRTIDIKVTSILFVMILMDLHGFTDN